MADATSHAVTNVKSHRISQERLPILKIMVRSSKGIALHCKWKVYPLCYGSGCPLEKKAKRDACIVILCYYNAAGKECHNSKAHFLQKFDG